jgi:hypothetical protein
MVGVAIVVTVSAEARADVCPDPSAPTTVHGWAAERLYLSPAGAGWFAADTLDWERRAAGALAMNAGYAHDPVHVGDDPHRLDVVEHQSSLDIAAAASFDRFRFSVGLARPLLTKGDCGNYGGHGYVGPSLDLGSRPDTLSDFRFGMDVRVAGSANAPFRLALGWTLFVPSGDPADFVSDGGWRGMLSLKAAGDLGHYVYAAGVTYHARPVDASTVTAAPRGSELLFDVALGAKLPLPTWGGARAVVGVELFGETALRSAFDAATTGLEAMLSARWERAPKLEAPGWRVKLGVGGGLAPSFGAAEWRAVAAIEAFAPFGGGRATK